MDFCSIPYRAVARHWRQPAPARDTRPDRQLLANRRHDCPQRRKRLGNRLAGRRRAGRAGFALGGLARTVCRASLGSPQCRSVTRPPREPIGCIPSLIAIRRIGCWPPAQSSFPMLSSHTMSGCYAVPKDLGVSTDLQPGDRASPVRLALPRQPNLPERGKPWGAPRPALPRAPCQGVRSNSVRVRFSPWRHDRPSARRNTLASARPPER